MGEQELEQEERSQVEEEARKQGWVEKELWRGNPDKWRPAEEFVERGNNIAPILKSRVEKAERDLKVALDQIGRIEKQAYERAKSEYEAKLADLEAKEVQAFNEGDAQAYQSVKKQREKLKPPEEPKPEHIPANNDFEAWRSDNQWWETDEDLTDYARAKAGKIQAKLGLPDGRELYDKVTEAVRAAFPHKFQNPKRQAAPVVEGEGSTASAGTSRGKRVFDNLPKSAKQSFFRLEKEFAARGRKFTKEDYVSSYQWDD